MEYQLFLNGKTHQKWAIFHSYVKWPEGKHVEPVKKRWGNTMIAALKMFFIRDWTWNRNRPKIWSRIKYHIHLHMDFKQWFESLIDSNTVVSIWSNQSRCFILFAQGGFAAQRPRVFSPQGNGEWNAEPRQRNLKTTDGIFEATTERFFIEPCGCSESLWWLMMVNDG